MAQSILKETTLYRILLLTGQERQNLDLVRAIDEEGLRYRLGHDIASLLEDRDEGHLDTVILDLGSLDPGQVKGIVPRCRESQLPVIAALPSNKVMEWDPSLDVDDVVVQPFRPGELKLRIRRVISRVKGPSNRRIITMKDLVIDKERYEVSVGGKKVLLTYKEYQLLVLLASTPGRVYGRDVLLNQVWGYDYFGGTRTVDVHIRRLRSKIEDANHAFIETVRNVGYRFKA